MYALTLSSHDVRPYSQPELRVIGTWAHRVIELLDPVVSDEGTFRRFLVQ